MTVIKAPRIIPRIVSSLMFSPTRSDSPATMLFSTHVRTGADRRRSRVTANRLPPPVLLHPHIGKDHAILDHPPEIFELPAGVYGPDRRVVDERRVLNLDVDRLDLAALDRV